MDPLMGTALVGARAASGAPSLADLLKGNRITGWLWTYDIGIYGAGLAGKTMLHNQLRRQGVLKDIDLEDRTKGLKRAHRKQVSILGFKRIIRIADVGGQSEYRRLWIDDMAARHPRVILFVVDPLVDDEWQQRNAMRQLCDWLTIYKLNTRPTKRSLWKRWNTYRQLTWLVVLVNKCDQLFQDDPDTMREIGHDTVHHPDALVNYPQMKPYWDPPNLLPQYDINVAYRFISAKTGWNVRASLWDIFRDAGII